MNLSGFEDSNLSQRLMRALTPQQGRMLKSIAREAACQGLPLYIVGGYVRDLLLDHAGMDFDLVVEGDAIGLARAIAASQGGRITVHPRFKTAQWFPPAGTGLPVLLDFISARSEHYKQPGALPTVIPGTLADDLRRRDFTINTLALRLDGDHFGELRDDMGGLTDIQAGLIRVLHPASFKDDPTRIFRTVRYELRYGFKVVPETLSLIPEACSMINLLSAERVRHELDLILEEENAAPMLKKLEELDILSTVHPALNWKPATQKRFVNGLAVSQTLEHPPSRRRLGWTLWLLDVPASNLESLDKRVHFDSRLRDTLLSASALFRDVDSLAGKKPSQCVAILDEIQLRAVQSVFFALPAGPARVKLQGYLEDWRQVKPRITGHDLKKLGLPPGPAYQTILRRLRAAWLDGELHNHEQEMKLLEKLTQ